MKRKCPISAQLVIPASFAECVTYEKQILWLKKEIENLSVGGDPAIIDELRNQISMLEDNIMEIQEELNSYNIQAIEESIEQMMLSITNLANTVNGKQDKLTFDSEPMSGSLNPVTSDGIHQAIYDEGMRLEQIINNKVDESTFNETVQNIVDNYATNEDVDQKLTDYATKTDISDMATKTELTDYVKTETLSDYATKQELDTYATKEELSGYVTEEELDTYVTEDDLSSYVTEDELSQATSNLATKEELNGKQNTLQFDATPTEGSSNPVTSDGIYNALQSVTPVGITDDTVTAESDNPVKSSGIYQFVQDEVAGLVTDEELADYATKTDISDMATKTELADYVTKTELEGYVTDGELSQATSNLATKEELNGKQNTLVFDQTPVLGSERPVTSDGIKKAIDAVVTTPITVDSSVSQSSENPVTSNGIYNFVLDQMGDLVTTDQLATKQDKLTFDQTPTAGSNNPVTSNGINSAIQTATQDVVRTSELSNYATKTDISDMATKTELANYATKTELGDYATKEELMDYATQDDISGIEQELSNYATNTSVSQALANKQDTLVFDDTPTADSQNPVRSGGIFNAIKNAGGGKNVLVNTGIMQSYSIRKHNSSGSYSGTFSGQSELILNIPEGQETLLLNPDANLSTVGMFNIDLPVSELSGSYTYFKISVASDDGFEFGVGSIARISNNLLYFYTFEYGVVVGYNDNTPTVIGILQQKVFTGTDWVGKTNINKDISTFDTVVITFPVKVLVKSKSSVILT